MTDPSAATAGPHRWLQDVTVAEITDGIAGSVAGAILASLGARVRKPVRAGSAYPAEEARTALDVDKEVVVATSESEWREVVETASVVIADIVTVPPSGRRHLHETARAGNPGVWVWVSCFGLDGPRRDLLGSDLITLASSGVLGSGMDNDRARHVPAGEQGLVTVGQVAALAALHGFDRFRCHGKPVEIDVPAQEAVAFVTALMELSFRLAGQAERPATGRPPAPTGVFPCRDGLIHIVAPDGHQWKGLVQLLGNPEWARAVTSEELRTGRDKINFQIARWTGGMERGDCVARLQEAGVPAAEVNEPLAALESEQFTHRGFFVRREIGAGSATYLPGPPFTVATTPGRHRRSPRGLADTTVVEMTGALAGPLAGSLLGAMGAHVVRIANDRRIDLYQRLGPFIGGVAAPDRSISFNAANHSKAWLASHFTDTIPHEVESSLAEADVVIDNLSSDYRMRLGLDKKPLAWDNLYLTISGFGRTGPRSSHRAYGPNVQAYASLASTTSHPDGWPWERQTPIGDTAAAVWAATVIAAWVVGGGQPGIIDLSLAEVVASRLALQFARAQLASADRRDVSAILQAAEGSWLAVSIGSSSEAATLAAVLGDSPRDDEQDTRTAETAADARQVLRQLKSQLPSRTAAQWSDVLQHAGIAAFPVLSVAELASDQQLRDRGFVTSVRPVAEDDSGLRVGLPWHFASLTPCS
jgi:crotonobetainyl-CoA:carnitine CoA-transferase CaiB-like acyl-CoA transferase